MCGWHVGGLEVVEQRVSVIETAIRPSRKTLVQKTSKINILSGRLSIQSLYFETPGSKTDTKGAPAHCSLAVPLLDAAVLLLGVSVLALAAAVFVA